MTKEELLNQLNHTKNNYIIGLAALSIFKSGQAIPLLEHHAAAFGDYTVTFDQVAELLRKAPDRGIALNEFNKMLMRTTIKESFEHIKEYCQDTNQFPLLKSEQWYEFARIIRNFLSHNCRFIFNKYDRERLPIKWKDFEITEELHGGGLGEKVFGNVETWELFQQFEDFVQHRLN
ncbi:MAG: hypothetical protein PVG93_04705 [Phycisphaerales bacterium]|jgi:hypothetical protein